MRSQNFVRDAIGPKRSTAVLLRAAKDLLMTTAIEILASCF